MMIRKRHQKLILTKWIEITEFVDLVMLLDI